MDSSRRPIIGVMGSGTDPHAELARPLGAWIAERGFHLLTGGGRGVMTSVASAYCAVAGRRGKSIGVLPAGRPPGDYPNPFVEIPIVTHLDGKGGAASSSSRNHINVLSSAVIVALPGGTGTHSEVDLAARYGRPVIAWWPPSVAVPESVPRASSLDDVIAFVERRVGE